MACVGVQRSKWPVLEYKEELRSKWPVLEYKEELRSKWPVLEYKEELRSKWPVLEYKEELRSKWPVVLQVTLECQLIFQHLLNYIFKVNFNISKAVLGTIS